MIFISNKEHQKRVKIPKIPMEERLNSFTEVVLGYTPEGAKEEAARCLQCPKAPCEKACPANQQVRTYIQSILDNDLDAGIRAILEDNPFPACCGRACVRPCEAACVRAKKGDAVAICYLKRFVSDHADFQPVAPELTGKKVAVIGAGPGGLAVAYFLALRGHKVEIFDAMDRPGGLLNTGIPPYKLPDNAVAQDVDRITGLGVEIHLETRVGRDVEFEQLQKDFDAVVIATGAWAPRVLNIPGKDLPGVHHAVDLIRDITLGREVDLGKKVIVIGGGNVAAFAARTVRRLVEETSIVYRRTQCEVKISPHEQVELKEEGIKILELLSPLEILGDDRVRGLRLQKMKLGEPDQSGRACPMPVEGETLDMDVDSMVMAIGQAAEFSFLPPDIPLEFRRNGSIVYDENHRTGVEGVYVVADAALGPSTIIESVASARATARSIDSYLSR